MSRKSQVATYTVVIFWVMISLAPVAWMILQSLKPPAAVFAIPPVWLFTPNLENYRDLFATSSGTQFGHYLVVSLIVTISTVVLTVAVSVPASYALTFLRVKRPNFWLVLILLASMLPPVVLLVPLFKLWNDFSLLDNPVILILTYTTFNIPFTVWLVRGFMAQVPRELQESALVDGAGSMRILVQVLLPVVRSGVAAASIFVVISAWNELLFAVLLTTTNRTAPAGIVATLISDRGINWGKLYAAATMVAVPIILFTIAVQRHVVRGFTFGAVKG